MEPFRLPFLLNMFVDTNNIAWFLAERGLLSFASVVDGDFMVRDQTSRNRNLKVIRKKSPGFFVKQIGQKTQEFMQSMTREAACYTLAKQQAGFRSLQPLLPELHYFDPVNYILILELLPNGESLWNYHQRAGEFPLEIGKLQGETLGFYHSRIKLNGNTGELTPFPRQIPWILSIHETHASYQSQLSGANSQLIDILQQYPEFPAALAAIKASWQFSALIHGDIKWENMMVCRKAEDAPLGLKIIDWEIADIGDECWDVAGVLQAYLSFWIFSLPVTGANGSAASAFNTEGIKPAMAAFWTSYAMARNFYPDTSRQVLVRCMSCAAARIIQTAYESSMTAPQLSHHALCKLQMSMNILKDPSGAVHDLMGL
jgi:Phosphotransferase enzyme family